MARIAVRVTGGIDDIAKEFGVDRDEILTLNNIDIKDVKEGMKLIVEEKLPIKYCVRPFDTAEKIAKQFGVSQEKLLKFNGIKEVFLGEIIYIPN
ncbi:MAG: LysM peptidoglycan-binding domain-containing protein [Clostridia bacterium]|jgi:LysM repeat protein|nr:LysM peptidoglycan-binding domain-containing protein [Clostridia bacterium]